MSLPLVGRVEIGNCAKTLNVTTDGRLDVNVAQGDIDVGSVDTVGAITDPVSTYPGAAVWESGQFVATGSDENVLGSDSDRVRLILSLLSGTIYLAINDVSSTSTGVPMTGPCSLDLGAMTGELNATGAVGGEVLGWIAATK